MLTESEVKMVAAKDFEQEWKHFCNHINFGMSNLDARAIRFMNEMPGSLISLIKMCQAVVKYNENRDIDSEQFFIRHDMFVKIKNALEGD